MDTLFVALSTWLHTLATIVMIGYFLFTSMIYLPVFEQQFDGNAIRELLERISARLRPFFGGSLLVFMFTGTHLMLINEDYLGLGNFFVNVWCSLMVIKHGLVLVFLTLAIYSERAYLPKISNDKPETLKQFRWTLNINMLLGLLIILLTSIAQAS